MYSVSGNIVQPWNRRFPLPTVWYDIMGVAGFEYVFLLVISLKNILTQVPATAHPTVQLFSDIENQIKEKEKNKQTRSKETL